MKHGDGAASRSPPGGDGAGGSARMAPCRGIHRPTRGYRARMGDKDPATQAKLYRITAAAFAVAAIVFLVSGTTALFAAFLALGATFIALSAKPTDG